MADGDLWAKRFAYVSLFNMFLAVLWVLAPLVLDQRISRTIAGGSVGTWGYIGFIGFVMVGVLGFAALSALYYILPRTADRTISSSLAWGNLALLEVGTLGATFLLSLAGYLGGIVMLREQAAGTPFSEIVAMVHERIAWTVEPIPIIAIFVALAALGATLGVLNLAVEPWSEQS